MKANTSKKIVIVKQKPLPENKVYEVRGSVFIPNGAENILKFQNHNELEVVGQEGKVVLRGFTIRTKFNREERALFFVGNFFVSSMMENDIFQKLALGDKSFQIMVKLVKSEDNNFFIKSNLEKIEIKLRANSEC